MSKNAIAFFTDRAMLPGLHAAITSMLASNQKLEADTFIFANGLNKQDEMLISQTWAHMNPAGRLHIKNFKPRALGGGLHGNVMPYGRLYLGELLPDYDCCIYLDCDLIINTSLQTLLDQI